MILEIKNLCVSMDGKKLLTNINMSVNIYITEMIPTD